MLPRVKGVVQGAPFSEAYALVTYKAVINQVAYAVAALSLMFQCCTSYDYCQ